MTEIKMPTPPLNEAKFVTKYVRPLREIIPSPVIQRVIDRMTSDLPTDPSECSYGRYLHEYVTTTLEVHRLEKTLFENPYVSEFAATVIPRLDKAKAASELLRVGLYSDVCFSCPTCRSRRRTWPTNVRRCPTKTSSLSADDSSG